MALELNGTTGVQGNSGAFVAGTAVASTSGTSIDFTSIPSWVKRVTVMFSGVSLSGSSDFLIQIGSGSVTTSGYVATTNVLDQSGSTGGTSSTSGFPISIGSSSNTASGTMQICLVSSNVYISSFVIKSSTATAVLGGGNVTLSGTLDRVRITTVNGTDTFDAGTINILYE